MSHCYDSELQPRPRAMDYDDTTIADVYDRGRSHGGETLALWMTTLGQCLGPRAPRTVVDLGCGTGRFCAALADALDASVVGVDPSARMLARARDKGAGGRTRYLRAAGERLPLGGASVDLVFTSMVFHHFRDAEAVARECRRVLVPDGVVFVRTGTVESTLPWPAVPFFPSCAGLVERHLPTRSRITECFRQAGFEPVSTGSVTQQVAQTHAEYADKLATGADSILARLPDGELARGVEALRRHARDVDPAPVLEPVDFFCFGHAVTC